MLFDKGNYHYSIVPRSISTSPCGRHSITDDIKVARYSCKVDLYRSVWSFADRQMFWNERHMRSCVFRFLYGKITRLQSMIKRWWTWVRLFTSSLDVHLVQHIRLWSPTVLMKLPEFQSSQPTITFTRTIDRLFDILTPETQLRKVSTNPYDHNIKKHRKRCWEQQQTVNNNCSNDNQEQLLSTHPPINVIGFVVSQFEVNYKDGK